VYLSVPRAISQYFVANVSPSKIMGKTKGKEKDHEVGLVMIEVPETIGLTSRHMARPPFMLHDPRHLTHCFMS